MLMNFFITLKIKVCFRKARERNHKAKFIHQIITQESVYIGKVSKSNKKRKKE